MIKVSFDDNRIDLDVIPELFWALADEWSPERTWLVTEPDASEATWHDPKNPGWCVSGTVAAAGAPGRGGTRSSARPSARHIGKPVRAVWPDVKTASGDSVSALWSRTTDFRRNSS
ncbi:MAG: hypothetical protein ACSLFB_05615 [Acidimicrobiales bacterium]